MQDKDSTSTTRMTIANILGSHLNPQQARLFSSPSGTRKRWIWSPQEDHLQLLAARAATDAINGTPIVIWYDEDAAAEEILSHYPFNQLKSAIYVADSHGSVKSSNALLPQSAEQGIHHIELYKLSGDYQKMRMPWASLHEELWPGTNRYDLIQKFAGFFNHSTVNPLFFRLSRTMFEISPAEYKRLRNKIEHHIKLSKLRQDGFECLDMLDVSLLVNHSLDYVKSEVMQSIALMADQATELLKRADWMMLRYFNYVKAYWVKEINAYVSKIDKLLAHAQELSLTFGDSFAFESSMSNIADKFKGQISRKAKMISQHRKGIKAQYLELLAEIEAGQPWVTISSTYKENTSLTDAIHNLGLIKTNLLGSKDAVETHIRSQLKRLNSHNAPDNTGLAAELKEWEDDLSKWYNNVNICGYFKKRFESQALSIHRSVEGLREVNTALTCIVERQHHLEDYFFWAGFHNSFPEMARTVVQALQLIPVKDWLTYFDEWYITQLVTGDALEVEWPQMMDEDLKEMIERIRHHAVAEYENELNGQRSVLREEYALAIRKLVDRKGTFDDMAAERFFLEMSTEDRSRWFPIQILPMNMMPTGDHIDAADMTSGKSASKLNQYILLGSKEPSMDLNWKMMQEVPCDVYSNVSPVNQRYLNERLEMPKMITDFKLGQSSNGAALRHVTNLARQFSPFLEQACIYSAHRVNMISLLGAELDRLVLDQLPMPYKISERSLNPDENYLVEALLEPNKPFVLLVRDFWPSGAWPDNSLWHIQFKDDMESLGIKVIHSWSKGWLLESSAEVKRVKDDILDYVGTSYTGYQMA
ncbi:MAG: hypothetical protein IPP15_17345 [Saprospiraceae bacterium]|uniref:Uncharacterized protein n=1 Tax=Candidatus Opimibacter skivensis TaxID=2982028 RepID=A0A9D7SXM4_9BACT|nr:hypothetical protein [Candidatus Opimibacter skivensis]